MSRTLIQQQPHEHMTFGVDVITEDNDNNDDYYYYYYRPTTTTVINIIYCWYNNVSAWNEFHTVLKLSCRNIMATFDGTKILSFFLFHHHYHHRQSPPPSIVIIIIIIIITFNKSSSSVHTKKDGREATGQIKSTTTKRMYQYCRLDLKHIFNKNITTFQLINL